MSDYHTSLQISWLVRYRRSCSRSLRCWYHSNHSSWISYEFQSGSSSQCWIHFHCVRSQILFTTFQTNCRCESTHLLLFSFQNGINNKFLGWVALPKSSLASHFWSRHCRRRHLSNYSSVFYFSTHFIINFLCFPLTFNSFFQIVVTIAVGEANGRPTVSTAADNVNIGGFGKWTSSHLFEDLHKNSFSCFFCIDLFLRS